MKFQILFSLNKDNFRGKSMTILVMAIENNNSEIVKCLMKRQDLDVNKKLIFNTNLKSNLNSFLIAFLINFI